MQELDCSRNQLASLDLFRNANLVSVKADGNYREVLVNQDRQFDISTLPRFERARMEDIEGHVLTVRGESIGGGNAVITRLNGVEVELTGNYCTMVVQHVDKKGTLAFVTTVLSAYDLNIGSLRLYRESRGKIAYAIIELDANVPEQVVNALKGIDAVINVLLVPAIHLD